LTPIFLGESSPSPYKVKPLKMRISNIDARFCFPGSIYFPPSCYN